MAEQQGFEPWRHLHALRDFESRLFDQLEYCSIKLHYYNKQALKNQGSSFLFAISRMPSIFDNTLR